MADSSQKKIPKIRTFAHDLDNEREKQGRQAPAAKPTPVTAAVAEPIVTKEPKTSSTPATPPPTMKPARGGVVTPPITSETKVASRDASYEATIITDTKHKRYSFTQELKKAVAGWFTKKPKPKPAYTVPTAQDRASIVQKATSKTARTAVTDHAAVITRVKQSRTEKSITPKKPTPHKPVQTWNTPQEPKPPVPPTESEPAIQPVPITPVIPIETPAALVVPEPPVPPTEPVAPRIVPTIPSIIESVPTAPPIVEPEPLPARDIPPLESVEPVDTPLVIPKREPRPKPEPANEPAPEPPRRKMWSWPRVRIDFRVVLAVATLGIIYLFYVGFDRGVIPTSLPTVTPPELFTPTPPTTFTAARWVDVVPTTITKQGLMERVMNSNDQNETITEIQFLASSGGQEIPGLTVFDMLGFTVDPTFKTSISDMALGFYRGQPWIVVSTNDYLAARGGVFAWEQSLPGQLQPLYGSGLTNLVTNRFADAVVNDIDVRIYLDSQGRERITYGFLNPQTLLITTHTTAFLNLANNLNPEN